MARLYIISQPTVSRIVAQHRRWPGLACMCGRPLGCKSFVENFDGRIDCEHVSGLCRRGTMSAGPDGIRDPAPNSFAASKAGTLIGFSGSRFDRSSSQSALSSRHQRALMVMTSKCQPLSRASSRPMPYGPSRCSITPEAPWRLDRLKLGKIEFNNRPQGLGERTVLLVRQRPASRHSGL